MSGSNAPTREARLAPREQDEPIRTLIHFEHPDKPGAAWCGASVHGIDVGVGNHVECAVCQDLHDRTWA